MKGSRSDTRRFLVQSIVLFLVMGAVAFLGVYISGETAMSSANQLGAMTADYLNLQLDAFLGQYDQILEDAAYMVNAMISGGSSPAEIEQWITAFSNEYDQIMQYDESGLYGVIKGEGVFSSGWEPGEEYDIYTRPWYTQAVEAGGRCTRSRVYSDARYATTMISLSTLLADGQSVLALDVRVGDIEVEWQEGSDVFPGTATVIDQEGNVVLHQRIRQEHTQCEMDDMTPADYLAWTAKFDGTRGAFQWEGELDTYQNYYIVGDDGWTCIVTIPRSVIMGDVTKLFYTQLALQGVFLLTIVYLVLRGYFTARDSRRTQDCLEALGQSYSCLLLVDAARDDFVIVKCPPLTRDRWPASRHYSSLLPLMRDTLYYPEDWEPFLEQFSLENLRPQGEEKARRRYLEYQQKDALGPRWVSAEAIELPGGDRTQVLLAFRGIHDSKTEQLEKNRMLRESLDSARMANQAKSDFLSRMSHDMRTPMNAVIGFANMAKANLDQPEKVADCLDKVGAASQQLLHLINEVLDTAKIEQGKMEMHMAPVDLVEHIEGTAELFRLQTKAQRQTFLLEPLALEHRMVLTDAGRLDQILNNLLSNAVKYTPPGGRIGLRVEELPGTQENQRLYRFTVTDTGIGMSAEFLERIFLPFEREDTSMTSRVGGVGLGMAITHSIVQMMGGRIDVESRRGEGSRFSVLLPCQLAQQPPASDECGATPSGEFSLEGRSLLVVEDNLLNMEIACELLRMEGAQVTQAMNGQEAVERFSQSAPGAFDAVLMDIQMPILDGYGATRAIRALPRPDAAVVPILAMTANAFEDDVIAAREAGMNGHIAKPIDIARIRSALCAVLRADAVESAKAP